MDERNRISLCFGDTPNESFAYSVLKAKGRRKAEYVARCIVAYEESSSKISDTTLSPVVYNIIKDLLDQQLATLPDAIASAIPEQIAQALSSGSFTITPSTASSASDMTGTGNTAADNNASSAASEPDTSDVLPVSASLENPDEDPGVVAQALNALSLFDNF